jgi:hypothetical protein
MQLAVKREQTMDTLRRGGAAVPGIRAWVSDLVARHANAPSVADRGFARLPDYFPGEVLHETRVVSVSRVPFPPLSTEFGLPELAEMERMPFSAITWANIVFVHTSVTSEATYFHELVHAVQWSVLGIDDYMLTCGVGLVECGFAQSPFEAFTYDVQRQFENGVAMPDLVGRVTEHARQTRAWAADFYQRLGTPIG